jgi:hypothetical protein
MKKNKMDLLIELLKVSGEKRNKIDLNTYLEEISSDKFLNQSEEDYQKEQQAWLEKRTVKKEK